MGGYNTHNSINVIPNLPKEINKSSIYFWVMLYTKLAIRCSSHMRIPKLLSFLGQIYIQKQ